VVFVVVVVYVAVLWWRGAKKEEELAMMMRGRPLLTSRRVRIIIVFLFYSDFRCSLCALKAAEKKYFSLVCGWW
jgi:phosphoglycerol transferase MdoB-like AlkP superfamily enzyme